MPYKTLNDLPGPVQNVLPKHAQVIYKQAFNHAWEEYRDSEKRRGNESQEQVAHKVAWAAVEKKYHKNATTGKWEKK